MKHSIKEWFLATRPWALPASVMPALTAISYIFYQRGDSEINWWLGALAVLGAAFFHLSGDLFNDYYDFVFKVDKKEDIHSHRILVDEKFTPKEIFSFAVILLSIGMLIGFFLFWQTGWSWQLLAIGAIGTAGTIFYNRTKYIALGDLCIFVVYGLIISLGTAFVLTGKVYWQILFITMPAGFLIVDFLHANNTRDIFNDTRSNIKTMALLLGLQKSKFYFTLLISLSFLLTLILVIFGVLSVFCLAVFLTFPIIFKEIKKFWALNIDTLEQIQFDIDVFVAKYIQTFSLIIIAGNILGGILKIYFKINL